jgi:hypothetical protein
MPKAEVVDALLNDGLKPLVGKWHVNYPVASVASLKVDQARELLFGNGRSDDYTTWIDYKPRALTVEIDYPLREAVRFTVEPETCMFGGRKESFMNFGVFLWKVAQKYKEIYRAPKKHGVWGHCMEDLVFEAIIVKKDGTVELSVGS